MKSLILRAPEVRALLDEGRVVVRRPLRWPILSETDGAKRRIFNDWHTVNECLATRQHHPLRCVCTPLGRVGERRWVRETFQIIRVSIDPETGYGDDWWPAKKIPPHNEDGYWSVVYQATDPQGDDHPDDRGFGWRPSVHMPRWASRLTAETRSVRVEQGEDGWAWVAELVRVDGEALDSKWLDSEQAAREETEFERTCERHREAEDALGWSPQDEHHD